MVGTSALSIINSPDRKMVNLPGRLGTVVLSFSHDTLGSGVPWAAQGSSAWNPWMTDSSVCAGGIMGGTEIYQHHFYQYLTYRKAVIFCRFIVLTYCNPPWITSLMSWLALPATFLAVHVYKPASLRRVEVITNVPLANRRIWAPSTTGCLSFCQETSGWGCPSATHSKLTGWPRTAVYSTRGTLNTGGTGQTWNDKFICKPNRSHQLNTWMWTLDLDRMVCLSLTSKSTPETMKAFYL